MEHLQKTPDEFCNLCYLLTAKSVHDSPAFKSWEGIGPSRERLAEQFQSMVYYAVSDKESNRKKYIYISYSYIYMYINIYIFNFNGFNSY